MDQSNVDVSWINFKNAWGACDGDVYDWVLHTADQDHQAGAPFHYFIMTSSNHPPFTFPEGKIDLPPQTDRAAVKYTDFAIGEFIEKAKSKPWFSNTLFVIVADHCAKSSGKTNLPLQQYHIPLIIWQPSLVPAQRVEKRVSQMDVAPTIAGLLHWSYKSLFFGKDILKMKPEEERAFVATYQKLGYYRGDSMTVLQPVRDLKQYQVNAVDFNFTPISENLSHAEESISYYQTASELFFKGLFKPTP